MIFEGALVAKLCDGLSAKVTDFVKESLAAEMLAIIQAPPLSLDAKLDKIIQQHYKSAEAFLKLYIGAADAGDKLEYLKEARNAFVNASAVETPDVLPFAVFYTAVCLDLLGDSVNAKSKYLETLTTGKAFLQDASSRNEKVAAIAKRTGLEVTNLLLMAVVVTSTYASGIVGLFAGGFAFLTVAGAVGLTGGIAAGVLATVAVGGSLSYGIARLGGLVAHYTGKGVEAGSSKALIEAKRLANRRAEEAAENLALLLPGVARILRSRGLTEQEFKTLMGKDAPRPRIFSSLTQRWTRQIPSKRDEQMELTLPDDK